MQPQADRIAPSNASKRALYAGFAVEGGLGVLAAAIAWLAGIPLAGEIRLSSGSLAWGLAGTLPMLAALAVLIRVPWRPIARIREIVRTFASQLLLSASWLEIAILCVLAGVGEELLFRGVVQTLIAGWSNQPIGILASGVLFGAVHFLTKTYFVLAVAVGCYLGWLYVATTSLTAPIVAHAVYDFVALAIILRSLRRDAPLGVEGMTD
jgi:membrane protease YdiL (CAAX protease family)